MYFYRKIYLCAVCKQNLDKYYLNNVFWGLLNGFQPVHNEAFVCTDVELFPLQSLNFFLYPTGQNGYVT